MDVALQLIEEEERKFVDEMMTEYIQKQIAEERQMTANECFLELQKMKNIFDQQINA